MTLTRRMSVPAGGAAAAPAPGPARAGRVEGRVEGQRVLHVQVQSPAPGQHAQHGPAGQAGEHAQPGGEQPRVTPELVDDEAADQGLVGRTQQGDGPEQGREHAAPVDVADHDDRQPGRPGQPHVGDVGVPQVDLRRAARALADDHVVVAPQVFQAVQGDLEQVLGVRAVLRGADLVPGLAEHDDVGAGVAARLEQHRVHPRVRLDTRRRGLHGLGPPDLRAVRGDEGVQRHVLGLERRDPDSLPGQPAAQPGGEHALPGVRGGPGDEQPAPHRRAPSLLAAITP